MEETAKLDCVGSVLEVGVLANDGRRLAAQLEHDGLEVLAAELSDNLTDASRAGEAAKEDTGEFPALRGGGGGGGEGPCPHSLDLPDRLGRNERLSDRGRVLGRDVDDREDASGETSLVHDLGDDGVRAGRHLARLEDGSVAGHDGLVHRALRERDGRIP